MGNLHIPKKPVLFFRNKLCWFFPHSIHFLKTCFHSISLAFIFLFLFILRLAGGFRVKGHVKGQQEKEIPTYTSPGESGH